MNGTLDLQFGCSSGAGDGFFDFGGLEFEQGHVSSVDGEERDASSVGHDDGGGGVLVVSKKPFDSDGVGLEAVEEGAEVAAEFFESVGDAGEGGA